MRGVWLEKNREPVGLLCIYGCAQCIDKALGTPDHKFAGRYGWCSP